MIQKNWNINNTFKKTQYYVGLQVKHKTFWIEISKILVQYFMPCRILFQCICFDKLNHALFWSLHRNLHINHIELINHGKLSYGLWITTLNHSFRSYAHPFQSKFSPLLISKWWAEYLEIRIWLNRLMP